jgi:imidazolonepropionase-like amidohydrolase
MIDLISVHQQMRAVIMNMRDISLVGPIRVGVLILGVLCSGVLVPVQARDEAPVLAIKAGKILPVTSAPIEPGIILVQGGKIKAVGQDVEIPADAELIDASDKVIIPGLIDAMTTLNEGGRDDEGSVTPDIRALDSFDFFGRYQRLLAGGVTTVHIAPGRQRLVPGYGAVVKLAGDSPEEQVLQDLSGLEVVLGEPSKNPPMVFDPPVPPGPDNMVEPAERQLPTTRMGQMSLLRQIFYQAGWDSTNAKPLDAKARALLQVLARRQVLRVNCHVAQDIRNALTLARTYKLKLIIEGATEAYKLIDEIKASETETAVIVASDLEPGRPRLQDYTRSGASGRPSPDTVKALADACISFALASPTDQTAGDLQFIAGYAVRRGLSPEQALETVTISPARILGIDERVGSIEPGKDADLLILSADPFKVSCAVERTLVNGKTVFCQSASAVEKTAEDQPITAIRAGRMLTASRGQILNGLILIQDGKIIYSGQDKALPAGATLIDASQDVVIPGMIDIHSHLGLHADSTTVGPRTPTSGPNSSNLRLASIAHALDPEDEAFAEVLRMGVTSILLAPRNQELVGGNGAVIKLAGDTLAERIVKEYAAVTFSMTGGSPRMAKIWQARDLLKRAKAYADRWERYERQYSEYEQRKARSTPDLVEPPQQPGRDTNLELLRGLFKRHMPALVRAERDDEIRNALTVFRDEFNLDTVLLGAGNAYRLIPELRRHGLGVALGPNIIQFDKTKAINNAALLTAKGIRVALHTSATSGTQYLPMSAAYAIRHGMEAEQAFQAVTLTPARLLHVEDRVGSIDVGKDADLVILTGMPFEFTTQVKTVMINGRTAYRRTSE